MNHYEFYKDQYERTLDHKNEINTSLSTPIGILTALVAALFYACTNFEYSDSYWLTFFFVIFGCCVLVFLAISLFSPLIPFRQFNKMHTNKALQQFYFWQDGVNGLRFIHQSQ